MAVEEHEGRRAIYILALCITVVCQSMYIITPYFTQQITDTFIVNENALQNLEEHTDVLIFMLAAMVGFTRFAADCSTEAT